MTTHYNTTDDKTPLCDGNHDWGEPLLSKGDTEVVLENGEPQLKIHWVIQRTCQNDNTVNTNNVYSTCQKTKTIENKSKTVPISQLP